MPNASALANPASTAAWRCSAMNFSRSNARRYWRLNGSSAEYDPASESPAVDARCWLRGTPAAIDV